MSPLPIVPASSRDEVRSAVGGFIAEVLGTAPANLSMTAYDCGTPSTATCADHFQHDVYASNGTYARLSYPLAQDLESRASFVEEAYWVAVVDGLTISSEVCISGIVDGVLVGVVMFDRQSCP